MDKVILGLLMLRALSQYDLLQAMQKKVSPFYKASLGSIQNALKKLEQQALVVVNKVSENGRNKLLYNITAEGHQYFLQWMEEKIDMSKFEFQISTKLFFFGYLKKEQRIKIMEDVILLLEEIIKTYSDSEKQYLTSSYEADVDNIVHYQLKTLNLAIHYYESTLQWFKALLAEEESR